MVALQLVFINDGKLSCATFSEKSLIHSFIYVFIQQKSTEICPVPGSMLELRNTVVSNADSPLPGHSSQRLIQETGIQQVIPSESRAARREMLVLKPGVI